MLPRKLTPLRFQPSNRLDLFQWHRKCSSHRANCLNVYVSCQSELIVFKRARERVHWVACGSSLHGGVKAEICVTQNGMLTNAAFRWLKSEMAHFKRVFLPIEFTYFKKYMALLRWSHAFFGYNLPHFVWLRSYPYVWAHFLWGGMVQNLFQ